MGKPNRTELSPAYLTVPVVFDTIITKQTGLLNSWNIGKFQLSIQTFINNLTTHITTTFTMASNNDPMAPETGPADRMEEHLLSFDDPECFPDPNMLQKLRGFSSEVDKQDVSLGSPSTTKPPSWAIAQLLAAKFQFGPKSQKRGNVSEPLARAL
ncbi:hypothetical protein TWF696_003952 [Orbilia brochopaga]|uniref:Uncharacterized protein n=1 Tax=Orbilia brochopaga TaxID=3140254 RepID=A0AAV9V7Q5_9PEZI